jgi:hypothetical protein
MLPTGLGLWCSNTTSAHVTITLFHLILHLKVDLYYQPTRLRGISTEQMPASRYYVGEAVRHSVDSQADTLFPDLRSHPMLGFDSSGAEYFATASRLLRYCDWYCPYGIDYK